MTLTLNLTDEEEMRLLAMAQRAGLDPESLIKRLIDESPDNTDMLPKSPADALTYWRSHGVLGSYGDPSVDSTALATEIRSKSELRAQ